MPTMPYLNTDIVSTRKGRIYGLKNDEVEIVSTSGIVSTVKHIGETDGFAVLVSELSESKVGGINEVIEKPPEQIVKTKAPTKIPPKQSSPPTLF